MLGFIASNRPWQIGQVYVFACLPCAGRMSHQRTESVTRARLRPSAAPELRAPLAHPDPDENVSLLGLNLSWSPALSTIHWPCPAGPKRVTPPVTGGAMYFHRRAWKWVLEGAHPGARQRNSSMPPGARGPPSSNTSHLWSTPRQLRISPCWLARARPVELVGVDHVPQ